MATAQIPWNDGSGHNISVEWDGTQDGEIKISSPTNPSLTAQRTKSIQVRTTAGSPQLTRTINVVQEAAVYTYEYSVTASSSATLAASGGSITYTAQLKTYLQGKLLKTETITPTCRVVSGAGFSASRNKVTAASRGTEYATAVRTAQIAVEFKAPETGETLSKTVTATQAANNRVTVYGKPTITSFEVADIPASGGSVSSGDVGYSQSRHYYYDSGQTEELTPLTTGGQVTFGDAVSAGSLGTTVKSRTIVGQLTCQVAMNGQTSVEGDTSVYQSANSATYGNVTITGGSVSTIPASGGSVSSASGISTSQTVSFTSGSTRAGKVSVTYSSAVSASSKGTTISNQTTAGTLTATATGEGSKKATKQFTVYQAKNVPVLITSDASYSYPSGDIAASGGTKLPTLSGSCEVTYSSGDTESRLNAGSFTGYSLSASRTWSMASASGFSINSTNGTVTAANRGTTAGNRRLSGNVTCVLSWTLTISSTYGGGTLNDSDTLTLTTPVGQQANTATYGAVSLTANNPSQVANTGGSATISASASQTVSFTSGSTRAGSVSITYTQKAAVSGFSLSGNKVTVSANHTTSARSYVVVVKATGEGSKSASKEVTVSQAAGVRTYSGITLNVSYSVIPASGGTSTPSISYSQTWGWNGATTGGGTITSGGTLTYSGTSVSTSNGAVSAGSKGTTVSGVTTVTTATVKVSLNGKSASKQVAVQQAANAITSYGTVTISGGTVSDIPAKGGSVSAMRGISASQTITYTSESTRAGTVKITYSAAVSGTSLGTTIKNRTKLGTLTATATGEGSKSATKTVDVYQAANTQTQTGIRIVGDMEGGLGWVPYANWDSIKANGKASDSTTEDNNNGWAIKFSGYKQYSYTSGATKEVYVYSIPSNVCYTDVDYIGKHDKVGFTLAPSYRGTTVGAARTGHVWWEENGFVSNKLAFTQEANAATTITYGTPVVSLTVADIPASGGSVSSGIVTYSQSRTQNYTSGATSPMSALTTGGIVSYSTKVSGTGLGTTIKNRTKLGTLTATVTMNGKSGSKSADVYQAGNYVKSVDLTGFAIAYSKSVSAAGATVTPTVTQGSVKFTFTSGASSSTTPSSTYGSLTSSVTYSGSAANGFSAPNSSSGAMTSTDRAKTEGAARNSGTVTATKKVTWTPTSSYNSGGTKTDSMSDTDYATQVANVKTDAGITYGTWQVSVSANRYTMPLTPCPASGGTCTITASASRTRTQNYSYTSGDTSTEALTNESGTPTLSISGTGASLQGTTVTWGTRGITYSISTRSATVTATMDTVKATEVVYQAKNEYADAYNNPSINRPNFSHNFTKNGGTWDSGVSVSQTGTRTYDSGVTAPLTGRASFTLSESVDWLSTSGGNITATANSTASSRNAPVTIKATGSGGKTASSIISITQDSGAYLNVSPTSLSFEASGGTQTITIDTNESWTIE